MASEVSSESSSVSLVALAAKSRVAAITTTATARLATRDELPAILSWLHSHWPQSIYIYHQVRHTIENSIDFVQFYVHHDSNGSGTGTGNGNGTSNYRAILSRNLRWRLEYESIHVFASGNAVDIWPCMVTCMMDAPLPYPLRSSPTPTSSTYRFACIAEKYFNAMQAFITANYIYGPGAPTTPPSFEHKTNTKGVTADGHDNEKKTDAAETAAVTITPTIANYECWSYILRDVSDFKPSVLPSPWTPQIATAYDTANGVMTITGVSLRSLTADDIPLVNSQWVYRNQTSTEHLLHAVAHYPSVGCIVDGHVNLNGVVTEFKSRLVCWILSFGDGSIGTLNTLPDYRRLGLAAAVSSSLISKRLAHDSVHTPFLFTTTVNVASMSLFTSLGFTRLQRHDWTAADGVVPKSN